MGRGDGGGCLVDCLVGDSLVSPLTSLFVEWELY